MLEHRHAQRWLRRPRPRRRPARPSALLVLAVCCTAAAGPARCSDSSDSSAGLSSMLRHPDFNLESGPDDAGGDSSGWRAGGCGLPRACADADASAGASAWVPRPAPSSLPPGVPPPRAWTATAGHRSAVVPVPERSASVVARFLHRQPWRQALCQASEQARAVWLTELCRLLPRPEPGRKFSKHPLLRCFPRVGGVRIDLYRLYHEVCAGGGLVRLTRRREMARLARLLGVRPGYSGAGHALRTIYVRLVYDLERAELRHPAARRLLLLASRPGSSRPAAEAVSRPGASICHGWGRGVDAPAKGGGGWGPAAKAGGEGAEGGSHVLHCPPPAGWSNVCARCRTRSVWMGVAMVGYREHRWGSKLCKKCASYLRSLILLGQHQHPEVMAFLAAPAAGCAPLGAPLLTTLAEALPRNKKAVWRTLYTAYVAEQSSALARRQQRRDEVAAKAGKLPLWPRAWRAGKAQWLAAKLLSLTHRCHLCRRRLPPSSSSPPPPQQHLGLEAATDDTFPPDADCAQQAPTGGGARRAKEQVCFRLGPEHVCATHSWAVGMLAAPAGVGAQGGGRKSSRRVRRAWGMSSGSSCSSAARSRALVDQGARLCAWCQVRN